MNFIDERLFSVEYAPHEILAGLEAVINHFSNLVQLDRVAERMGGLPAHVAAQL